MKKQQRQDQSMQTGLIRYDAMIHAIVKAHAIDEVKDIRDKALALEKYAQQALNTDAERKAIEIRLRAERKAGQMLKTMKKAKGNQYINRKSARSHRATKQNQMLSDMGISKTQSSRWQKLAKIHDSDFEEALVNPHVMPSTQNLIRTHELAKNPAPKMPDMSDAALELWGVLSEIERHQVMQTPAKTLIDSMTQAMREDVLRITPNFTQWLQEIFDEKH